MMTNETAQMREREHAKLFTFEGRQVLAHLQRDEAGRLVIIFQLWVADEDHQLRCSITAHPEEVVEAVFEDLNDESIAMILVDLGVPAILAGERDHG